MDAMKKQEELDNYYITLNSVLVENNLMDKPGQIYNVDESGMPLEHRSPFVLAKKEKDELAKKKAEEKSRKASQSQRQSKRSGKRLATSQSSNEVEISSLMTSYSSTTTISEVGISLSFATTHNTVMHTTELNSKLSTTSIAPPEPSDQDYECCECFGTFEEDVMLGNEAEWAQCDCGRWIHADCITETAMDENGKPRMCSNCVV